MLNEPDGSNDRIVDPARYELDATWNTEASIWARTLPWILDCVRRQTAALGIGAILALFWMAGARAQDPGILVAAFGAIVVITVSVELIDGKVHDQHGGQGEDQSRHASPDQTDD